MLQYCVKCGDVLKVSYEPDGTRLAVCSRCGFVSVEGAGADRLLRLLVGVVPPDMTRSGMARGGKTCFKRRRRPMG